MVGKNDLVIALIEAVVIRVCVLCIDLQYDQGGISAPASLKCGIGVHRQVNILSLHRVQARTQNGIQRFMRCSVIEDSRRNDQILDDVYRYGVVVQRPDRIALDLKPPFILKLDDMLQVADLDLPSVSAALINRMEELREGNKAFPVKLQLILTRSVTERTGDLLAQSGIIHAFLSLKDAAA